MDALATIPSRVPLRRHGKAAARLELINIRKRYGDFTAWTASAESEQGPVRVPAGPVGLWQDHDLAHASQARGAGRRRHPDRRREATRDPPWQRDIAMMFQDFALFPHMTVAKQWASASRC